MEQRTFDETVQIRKSKEFYEKLVTSPVMFELLRSVIVVGEQIDAAKKALFYGKGNPELIRPLTSDMFEHFEYQNIDKDLLHAILGLITEVAELADRAIQIGNDPEDPAHGINLVEEFGDIEWYMSVAYKALNLHRPDVLGANDRKLEKRFGSAFSTVAALNRNLPVEQEALKTTGMTCDDEGCPHYGTAHAHTNE